MKVQCPRCGKQFQYEERNGICSQCNYYMPTPIMAPETDFQKKWKFTKAQTISCSILLLLMLLVPCIAIPYTNSCVKERTSIRRTGILTPQSIHTNDFFTVNGEKIRISGCKEMKEWKAYAPDGFSILLVSYETEEYTSDISGYDFKVYLKLPEGEYIEPIMCNSLSEEVGISENILSSSYNIVSEFEELGGSFAFLVPDSISTADFSLYYIPERSGTRVLDSVYQFAINWEDS